MGNVMVYTIDSEDYVIDQFECEREYAINNYWSTNPKEGLRYLIANPGEDIKHKWRRKPLRDIKHTSISEVRENQPSL